MKMDYNTLKLFLSQYDLTKINKNGQVNALKAYEFDIE